MVEAMGEGVDEGVDLGLGRHDAERAGTGRLEQDALVQETQEHRLRHLPVRGDDVASQQIMVGSVKNPACVTFNPPLARRMGEVIVREARVRGFNVALGGGIGSYWGNLRSIGEPVGRNGKTSGIVPFIRVQDSLTLAISQGSLRRGFAPVQQADNVQQLAFTKA